MRVRPADRRHSKIMAEFEKLATKLFEKLKRSTPPRLANTSRSRFYYALSCPADKLFVLIDFKLCQFFLDAVVGNKIAQVRLLGQRVHRARPQVSTGMVSDVPIDINHCIWRVMHLWS
jgi:hypothetical protein